MWSSRNFAAVAALIAAGIDGSYNVVVCYPVRYGRINVIAGRQQRAIELDVAASGRCRAVHIVAGKV